MSFFPVIELLSSTPPTERLAAIRDRGSRNPSGAVLGCDLRDLCDVLLQSRLLEEDTLEYPLHKLGCMLDKDHKGRCVTALHAIVAGSGEKSSVSTDAHADEVATVPPSGNAKPSR